MICEKCWADAYLRSLSSGKPQYEEYKALLLERADKPCSPEQASTSPSGERRSAMRDPLADHQPGDPRNEAVKLLLLGLTTDGAGHKQWVLEKTFRALCEDAYVDNAKTEFGWEEGIAP